MFLIICFLNGAPPLCFPDGVLHGIRHHVGVHDHMSFAVAGGAADGLDERNLGTEESFLIRVQNGDQGDLRNVKTFPEKVDPYQDVKNIQAHIPDDLRPLQGVDIRVKITDPDPYILHIIRKVLRHALGEGGDQDLVAFFRFLINLADQIVDLSLYRPNFHFGIQKAGGPDDLLRPEKFVLRLVLARGGGDEEHLIQFTLKFLEA